MLQSTMKVTQIQINKLTQMHKVGKDVRIYVDLEQKYNNKY